MTTGSGKTRIIAFAMYCCSMAGLLVADSMLLTDIKHLVLTGFKNNLCSVFVNFKPFACNTVG